MARMFASTLLLTAALFLSSVSVQSITLGYISVCTLLTLPLEFTMCVQVFAVLMFVVFFEIGLGPIPWLITAEIFPAEVSATAMTATCSLNWVSLEFLLIGV